MVVEKSLADAQNQGVTLIRMPCLVRHINPFLDLSALIQMWRLIRRYQPAVVHTHTSKAGLIGRLAAKLARAPVVLHTPHGHVFFGHFSKVASRLFLMIERIADGLTDRLVVLTEGERSDYLRLGVCRAEKMTKIHSGIDLSQFENIGFDRRVRRMDLSRRIQGAWVGFVGWLLPIKAPEVLMEAMAIVWKRHPDTTLVYLGKGDMESTLRQRAKTLGHDARVVFLGWREDVNQIMPLFDLLVLPSRNEGMGRVIVEAMAAGKPVIGSNIGGIPDLVEHGKTGFLVPPGDEVALADAIAQLIENPELAKKMCETGRSRCHQFSLQSMLDKLDNLYQEVLTEENIKSSEN